MVLVLFIAALISLIIGLVQKDNEQFIDVIIIFAVVLLNAGIGTYQEAKAEKALEALKKMSSPTATVKRNGKIMEIKTKWLKNQPKTNGRKSHRNSGISVLCLHYEFE